MSVREQGKRPNLEIREVSQLGTVLTYSCCKAKWIKADAKKARDVHGGASSSPIFHASWCAEGA